MIYLDNSATTPLCKNAVDNINKAIEYFGNPSSLHSVGFEAEKLKESARDNIFKALGVRKLSGDTVIFTSGGTEANNMAIFGCVRSKQSNIAKRIITTDSEHPSILTPLKILEKEGYEVIYLPTKHGKINIEDVEKYVNNNTVLISIMAVNNETGAVYDVQNIFKTAKAINPNITTHSDCVQGFMKIPFCPSKMNADMCTISSHKIHGPKGCGALYISSEIIKTKRISPIIYGGGQEKNYRSGTENMLGICGFGGAVEYMYENFSDNIKKMSDTREYAKNRLSAIVTINEPEKASPNIINITLPNIKSETMLHFLSSRGIFVSSGSACSSNHAKKASHVLVAFGLTEVQADCSLRISLSENNTLDDIDIFVNELKTGIELLAKMK